MMRILIDPPQYTKTRYMISWSAVLYRKWTCFSSCHRCALSGAFPGLLNLPIQLLTELSVRQRPSRKLLLWFFRHLLDGSCRFVILNIDKGPLTSYSSRIWVRIRFGRIQIHPKSQCESGSSKYFNAAPMRIRI
jgi:hypothetical protein